MRPGALIAPERHATGLLSELWTQADEVRREWLAVGLSTEPADRSTTEEAIASIYARHRRTRPRFRWVDSPRAALPHLGGRPDHAALLALTRSPLVGVAPLASDVAAGLSRLRGELDDRVLDPPRDRPAPKRKSGERWPLLPPDEALRAGIPFLEIVRQGVREALLESLGGGVYRPIRAALGPGPIPVGWYGHQDASWVAYYDALRRIGLAPAYPPLFDLWVTLTRAAGWWWPGERECVLVERPVTLRVTPALNVVYRDGWSV